MSVTMMWIICVLWLDLLIYYVLIIANFKKANKPTVYNKHTLPNTLKFLTIMLELLIGCDSITCCSDPFTCCKLPVLQLLR